MASSTVAASSAGETSYATDETSQQLWYEQSINASVYIGAMAWGLQTAIFYATTRSILHSKRTAHHLWLIFAFTMFSLTTISICCNINFNQRAWIDERNYPGGPIAFFSDEQSLPVNAASITTSVITFFLADGLLIARCYALWRNFYITTFLLVILIASTVMSVLHCIQATRATGGAWDDSTLSLSVPYASLAMSLNVLLVITLLWRLVDLRRKLPATLNEQARTTYTSLEAIIVESAFPYGLVSFLFLILYGVRNIGANLFLSLLVQLEGIVSDLIIMRIASGNAWSMDILRQVGPRNVTFRGQLGRSADGSRTHDLSMMILHDDSQVPADTKTSPDDLI
ncbi:uncharacterized protein LAESUDRAFT_752496 [Laetiporus sulphureus 93-53]|uniref:Uncharacterized protein n=1 Tax=Laetiporus sulphureus 93-53 TaxID=1314785 RepID=A0A165BWP5_9APHY|nr:uncharacterized protein LAESUDRAFT_752496 [Laetiporus sulphureus 93-53]KZT01790.1 hypothetical protein LAESUDRAFT_752496 [Laetiporus sulphureus 93-53]